MDGIGVALATPGIATDSDDAHVEGLRESCKVPADRAGTHDDHGLAAELVLSYGGVADHIAPDALRLIVARLGKPPRESEHERHRVLRNRSRVDTAGACEPDAT